MSPEIDDDVEIMEMSTERNNNSLHCRISTSAKELPTIWYKDGDVVDIQVQQRSESLKSMLGLMGRPTSSLPEPGMF